MAKRSYDEFIEVMQNYEPHEIVENLKKMGGNRYEKIISDPKLLHDIKALKVRLNSQLYKAFKHLLTQRHWNVPTKEDRNEFWINTMEYLNLPDHSYVRSLPRDTFLLAFEQTMLAAHQGLAMEAEFGKNARKMPGGALLDLKPLPSKTASYDAEHKKYNDHMSSVSTWLNHADRDDVEREAGLAEGRRKRFKSVIPGVDYAEYTQSSLKEKRCEKGEAIVPELSMPPGNFQTPSNRVKERHLKDDESNTLEVPMLPENPKTPTVAAKSLATPSPIAKQNGKSIAIASLATPATPRTPPNRNRYPQHFANMSGSIGSPAKKLKSKLDNDEGFLISFAGQEPGVYTPLRKTVERSAKLAAVARWVKESSIADPEELLENRGDLSAEVVKASLKFAEQAYVSTSGAKDVKASTTPQAKNIINPLGSPNLLSSSSCSSNSASSSSSGPGAPPELDRREQATVGASLDVTLD